MSLQTPHNDSTRMAVACIVPMYNNRDAVVEAIQSVLTQTRSVDEIIVVDDGSTDGSAELVEKVFENRVHVIRQENRGAAAARNTGICNSSSDLIAFLDADDRWLPARVERQAAFMESHPLCMFCFSAHLNWSEHINETRVVNTTVNYDTFLRNEFFRGQQFIATDTVILCRQALNEVGLFDETLRVGQDTDLWLRIMVRYGFEHIPEPLAWVRRSAARRNRAGRDLDRDFQINEHFYAKHRYTFGAGFGGSCIWRDAWGFSLRYYSLQFVDHGRRSRALAVLLRGIVTWPFVAPGLTARLLIKTILGKNLYKASCDLLGFIRSAFHWNRLPRRYNNR